MWRLLRRFLRGSLRWLRHDEGAGLSWSSTTPATPALRQAASGAALLLCSFSILLCHKKLLIWLKNVSIPENVETPSL